MAKNENGMKSDEHGSTQTSMRKTPPQGDGKIPGQGKQEDTSTTLLMKNKENFAEIVNNTICCDTPVSPEELTEADIKETATIRITREGGGTALVQYRDSANGVNNTKECRQIGTIGIENASDINYQMPFRVLQMDFVNYARQVRVIEDHHNHEWKDDDGNRHVPSGISSGEYSGRFLSTDKLLPCITLVINWSDKPWDGPKKLSEMFEESRLTPLAWDLEMNVLDVCTMTEEEICAYKGEMRTVFGFVRYSKEKEKLRDFMGKYPEYFRNVSRNALDAINEVTHLAALRKLCMEKYQTNQEGEGYELCKAIDDMLTESRDEGQIIGTVETLREEGYNDEKIIDRIMKKFELPLKTAQGYLTGMQPVHG